MGVVDLEEENHRFVVPSVMKISAATIPAYIKGKASNAIS